MTDRASANAANAHQDPAEAIRALAEEAVQRLAQRGRTPREAPPTRTDAEAVRAFAQALAGPEAEAGLRLARAELRAGLDFDALCERRLAPAARRLGTLWETDRLSFADVTLAAHRLFAILRTLAPRPASRNDSPFAVFAAPPGEGHVLGVTMAAERARSAGWEVLLLIDLPLDETVARAAAAEPLVVGLTLATRAARLPLARLVGALRVALPATPIVVAGPGLAHLETTAGIDALAPGFDEALAAMDRLTGRATA